MTGAESITSGYGAWNPLIWVAAAATAWVITIIIRSFGDKRCKRGTEQTEPFVSGDRVDIGDLHIKAANLYWGFTESMRGYYRRVTRAHTGRPADYILWLLGVTAVVLLMGMLT
jgi:hypothetical protein